MKKLKHLVVVGNGMAGMACVDAILKKKPDFKITVLSEEPHYNYNRILLSSVLAGEKKLEDIYINTKEWYEANTIDLRLSSKAIDVDADKKAVKTSQGEEIDYDLLLLATGSNPFIPPMKGVDKKGVYVFRNIADCEGILSQCKEGAKAAVIGGGLLGLEAAKGISGRGVKTTVVHLAGSLMEMQLDLKGGKYLRQGMEKMGIDFKLEAMTQEVLGGERVEGLRFKDGSSLEADFIVVACGIKPNIDLAKKANLELNRGIVVNDYMETSDPSIFAVGECVEHRGKVYGLVAPLWDQGKVLAETITGNKGSIYEGSVLATKLKVAGVEVFSVGEFRGEEADDKILALEDELSGVYKKIIIRDNKLVGAVLVGDTKEANDFQDKVRSGKELEVEPAALLFGTNGSESDALEDVMSKPDHETICGCIGVTKGQIVDSIKQNECVSVKDVKACTQATSGCGTCAKTVECIIQAVAGDGFESEKKDVVCTCIPFPKEQLRQIINSQKIKSVQDLLEVYGNGIGCANCKPALSYIIEEVTMGQHLEDRSQRFINDRVHANIQKDGTYSVVPRMRGGVTTPTELRKIANVADKYNVPMVKVTGSQRLDLLGIKKADLPKIWAELDMPSGHAYAKAVRMVKTCVGKEFCRYGTQNSIETGIQLEKDLEGLYTPAKVKMGVVGCPRNCAEATVKDIGLIGIEGGWQVVIGGGAGKRVREADLLTTVTTSQEAMDIAKIFFQYYREHGEYLERTYDFVERIGIEAIRREVLFASEETKQGLMDRLLKSKSKVVDPWAIEAKKPYHKSQFESFVLPKDQAALLTTV
ncbi:MAG: nitrite reductase (NADH) large subunit [Candidatus Omnitrophota bacterium]|jgi:nitrite reductase (NADH) large subunit